MKLRGCFCLFVCFLFLTGCQGLTPKLGPIPDRCKNSIIMNKIPNYRAVDVLLQLANVEAIKHSVYTKQQALDAISELEEKLKNPNLTYAELLADVMVKINWVNEHAGVEVFIISQYFDLFNKKIQIDQCDRELLLAHLQKQKRVISLLK